MGKKVTTKLRFKNNGDIDVVNNCAAYINMTLSDYTTRAVYEFTKAVLEQRKQHAAASKAKAVSDGVPDTGGTVAEVPASEDVASPALADAEAAPATPAAE